MQACHFTPRATGRKVKYIYLRLLLYGGHGNPYIGTNVL